MRTALVVGAGPTGLTAALALARHGVAVEVRESESDLSGASLASTIHPPSLQILYDLGVDLSDAGLIVDTVEYRQEDRRLQFGLRTELTGSTPFPYRQHIPRLELCRRILAVLRTLPDVDVRFGAPAHPGPVSHDLVVAADGPDSRWRDAAGIGFEAHWYPGQVTRLICDPDTFANWAGVTYVFTDDDSLSVLRLADHARVILRTGTQPPQLPQLLARANAVLGVRPRVLDWSTYRARRAICSTNLRGRLIVTGDAAHLTNTRGGMNMNAGIHDAAVLARSFALGSDELAAAAAERLRIATDALVPRTHATLGGSRFDEVAAIHADPRRRGRFVAEAAMLDMVRWP